MKKLLFILGLLFIFSGCSAADDFLSSTVDVVTEAKINSYASSAYMLKEYASLFIVENNDVVLHKSVNEGTILDIRAIGEGSFSFDSFGEDYDLDNSYVVVAYDGYEYIFYITLQSGVGNKGVIAVNSDFVSGDSVSDITSAHTFLSNIEENNVLVVDQDGDGEIDIPNIEIVITSICKNVNGDVVCSLLE